MRTVGNKRFKNLFDIYAQMCCLCRYELLCGALLESSKDLEKSGDLKVNDTETAGKTINQQYCTK